MPDQIKFQQIITEMFFYLIHDPVLTYYLLFSTILNNKNPFLKLELVKFIFDINL